MGPRCRVKSLVRVYFTSTQVALKRLTFTSTQIQNKSSSVTPTGLQTIVILDNYLYPTLDFESIYTNMAASWQ